MQMRVVKAVKKHVNDVRQMQINLGSYLGHCLTNSQHIVQKMGMLFLAELLKIAIVFFIPILRDIPGVCIVVSVVSMIELLKTWDVVTSILETGVCFAHSRIKRLDEDLAGELNSMIEALDVVSVLEGVIEFVESSCLDLI